MTSRLTFTLAFATLLFAVQAPDSRAQCQLANPSFELPGPTTQFAGWNQIEPVAVSLDCVAHGQLAAKVSGTGSGSWSISGLWQPLDALPGQVWCVEARVGHDSANPLVGDARGIVNVEWRDASDDLISYESIVAVAPGDPTDVLRRVVFETEPAPPNTVTARIVLAKLHTPTSDAGGVIFDLVEFRNDTAPVFDDVQWPDFPGGRTLDFAGYTWRVKGPGFYGPGPSQFSDDPQHVWVDNDGDLHLAIRNAAGTWFSTEVTLEDSLDYGDYMLTTIGRHDDWAPNVIFGFFLWQYLQCYEPVDPWNLHAEFDLELGRWGDPNNEIGQFVAQPWDYPGNIARFDVAYAAEDQQTTFAFRCLPDRVEARAWCGGPYDEHSDTLIHTWTYTGPHLPLPELPRIHMNFWQLNGPPANTQEHEIVIDEFLFAPLCADITLRCEPHCLAACLAGPQAPTLTACAEYDLDGDGDVDLADVMQWQR